MLLALIGAVAVSVVLRHTTFRLEIARAQLRRAADLDPVTDLYNRRGFRAVAERLRTAADEQGRPLVVLCVDIDRMKLINDRFGHAAGDAAIRDTARLLRQALRRSAAGAPPPTSSRRRRPATEPAEPTGRGVRAAPIG